MSQLLKYIPQEKRGSLVPELVQVCGTLPEGLEKERAILKYFGSHHDVFSKVFREMISNGLRVDDLKTCSGKSKEWDTLVNLYFESMDFDSIIGIEDRFFNHKFGHSITLSIPLSPSDLDMLLSLKNDSEKAEGAVILSRSMLLMVEKNYGHETWNDYEGRMAQIESVLEDCSQILKNVLRLEIRHFFNEENFDKNAAQNELREDDMRRQKGLDLSGILMLSPIYIDKFSEMNHPGLYSSLLKRLTNVKGICVDVLTEPLVDALIQTGCLSNLEHALLNTKDPRLKKDIVSVKKLLVGSIQTLKLLHANTSVAVIETLERNKMSKLVELDVTQNGTDCAVLIEGLIKSAPVISKVTLKPDSLSFLEFVAELKYFLKAKPTVDTLLLDIRKTDLPRPRQVQTLQSAYKTCFQNIKTLGLILHCGQIKTLDFVKLFDGTLQLRLIICSTSNEFSKQTIERSLFDTSKPSKVIWNMIRSLQTVKLFNDQLLLVTLWDKLCYLAQKFE